MGTPFDPNNPLSDGWTPKRAGIEPPVAYQGEDQVLNATYASKANAIDPTAIGYDVIVVAGQSNAAGFYTSSATANQPDTTYLDTTDPRIWRWVNPASAHTALVAYHGVISLASDPLGHSGSGVCVGPGMPFAREYIRSVPTHRKVLIVPVAVGSTALQTSTPPTWNSTVRGSLFDSAVTVANAAIAAAGANARVAAFLWVQGETDSTNSVSGANYQTALDAMIAAFRSGVTGATASTPFIVGSMVPSWTAAPNGTSVSIAAVHAATPARVPYTGYAAGPNGSGDIHYTAAEQRVLGARMFAAYQTAVTNTLAAGVPAPPSGLIATPSNGQVALAWIAPASPGSAITDYVIEYKTSAASTWTTFADGVSTAASATVTGLTNGTSYDFRVSAVNSSGQGTASSTVTALASATLDPNTITGLLSWFKADALTAANGASVTSWTDSKAGNAATGTGTYVANAVNGKPAVAFVAASSQGLVTAATYAVTTSYTYFLVAAVTTTNLLQQQFIASFTTSGGAQNHSWISGFVSGQVAYYDGTQRNIAAWTNGQFAIYEVVTDGTGNTSDKLKNGTSAGTSTAFASNAGSLQQSLGRPVASGASYADAQIAETLFYGAALIGSDRTAIRQYLGGKYGIAVS